MKKWFKRGIFTVVTLFIVAVVGAAVFLLTFDPNAYKERVEQIVQERYQRTLEINGEIELSLFPRIGLSVADVSLSDRNNDQPFAAVDSARVAVAVWPLLWNHLVVDHVAVSGFKVWLNRDEEGVFNFIDLLQRASPPSLAPTPKTAAFLSPITVAQANTGSTLVHDTDETVFQIDIAGLELKEGEVHFSDRQSQTQLRVVDLSINTGRMTFDQPFDVIFKGQLQGDKPQANATLVGQSVVQLEPHLRRYIAQRINVSVVGDVGPYHSKSATLRGGLEWLTLTEDLRGHNIELVSQGRWQNPTMTLNNTSINLTAKEMNLKHNLDILQTKKLKIRVNGVLPTPSTDTEHKIEVALDVPQLSIEPEQVQSQPISLSFKQSQGEHLFGVNAKIKALSGHLAELNLEQVQADVASKRKDSAWKIEGVTDAQAQLTGRDLSVQWQELDANLRVDNEALNPNPAHAKITSSGQWSREENQLLINGLWQSANTHAQFDSALQHNKAWHATIKVDAKEIDINPWLRSKALQQQRQKEHDHAVMMLPDHINWETINTQLTLQAEALQVGDYPLEAVQLEAEQAKGVITLKELQSVLFDGELVASGLWHAESNAAELKADLQHADLALLSNASKFAVPISGVGNLQTDLRAHGATAAARWSALDGSLALNATEGRLTGWGVWQQVEAEADTSMPFNPDLSTTFTTLKAHLDVQQGQAIFSEFDVKTPQFNLQMEPNTPTASMDLVNQQLYLPLLGQWQHQEEGKEELPFGMKLNGPWQDLRLSLEASP